MIPIAVPSAASILLLLLSFVLGLWLISWLVLLAFSKGSRQWLMKKPRRNIGILVALAVLSVPGYSFEYILIASGRESARREAALRVTLPQAQTLGGVEMPAGTRLELDREGRLDTFVLAEFDAPVSAYGVQATRIRRTLSSDYDEQFNEINRYPGSVTVWGQGAQDVSGWQCDASKKLDFDAQDKGARIGFDKCLLAGGNRVGDIVLPAGAELHARTDAAYGDTQTEPVRWSVSVDGPEPLAVQGLLLGHPALHLDAQRRLVRVAYGVLACPTRLGPMHYPAETEVQMLRYPLSRRMPGAWVFTPYLGMSAPRDDGPAVRAGSSVLQRLDGTVLDVVANEKLMIELYPRLEVDGVVTPGPVNCPQAAR
ncbi:membrane protein [Bordetella ansorpii]|uniref:Membrane protein n=1 Tax=Bordetella ansorpii TaxID=288768 RepID=A0A157MQ38_9BORD|nr:hypothetical protein [Bordetella ansorpii]SAI11161.1 membrane protein [Bordetella ansorpii]